MTGNTRIAIGVSAIAYVAIVLAVDTLAVKNVEWGIAWRELRWWAWGNFDASKFVAWFIVPFVLALPAWDGGWFGVTRWKRADGWLLAGMILLGAAVMAVVAFIPSLRDWYPSHAGMSAEQKWDFVTDQLIWTASWLPGWEVMHRYFLLRALILAWPRTGWLLVPVFEGLYHLQKAPLEAAGMFVFGLALTWWAMKRRNVVLPFLAHLIIEIELILFLVLV